MSDIQNLFRDLVFQERCRQQLTQQQLAELAGSSPKHISKIECGHGSLGFDLLGRILEALDIEIKYKADHNYHSLTFGVKANEQINNHNPSSSKQ